MKVNSYNNPRNFNRNSYNSTSIENNSKNFNAKYRNCILQNNNLRYDSGYEMQQLSGPEPMDVRIVDTNQSVRIR